MDKEKKKGHLRLIKSARSRKDLQQLEQEIMEELENLEDLEFLLLTNPPDWTVAIDKRAPLEVKLRVLAAVKSCTLGNKSIDHLLRKYREFWEEKLTGKD